MGALDLGQTAALKDDVDDGVDIGDVHLAVTIHIGTAFIGVDLPMDDAGIWYAIQPGSMDEALYDFLYECLRRKGKL